MQLKKRGVNAIAVQGGSDLRAHLERLFGAIVVGTTLFCVAFAVHRSITAQLGDIGLLEVPALAWCGAFSGTGGATLVAFAQFDMGASWRIGVPRNEANPLVTQGLFRLSRNPIYLGMLIALAGIFLIAPNAVTAPRVFADFFMSLPRLERSPPFHDCTPRPPRGEGPRRLRKLPQWLWPRAQPRPCRC